MTPNMREALSEASKAPLRRVTAAEFSPEAHERFWAKVDQRGPEECWPWLSYVQPNGYGRTQPVKGRNMLSHRMAYELAVGPIPEGLHLDHLCRNRACCNPAHLEAVTPAENQLRGVAPAAVNARKAHCDYGHPFSGENLRVRRNGARVCRICQRRRDRERYLRHRKRRIAAAVAYKQRKRAA